MKKLILFIFLLNGLSTLYSQVPEVIFLYVNNDCEKPIPDFRDSVFVTDNCGVKDVVQNPTPGTILNSTTPETYVTITAVDSFNNSNAIGFLVLLLDTIAPIISPKRTEVVNGVQEIFPNTTQTTYREATPVIMEASGTITKITTYHNGYPGGVFKMGIYDNLGRVPNKKIAETLPTSTNSEAGYQIVELISNVHVNQGDTIWLATVKEGEGSGGFNFKRTEWELGRVMAPEDQWTWEFGMPEYYGTGGNQADYYQFSINAIYIPDYIGYTESQIKYMYKIVEEYVGVNIDGYVEEFPWSTASIDTIFRLPKCIPIGMICPEEEEIR